jgi:molybdopterin-guanine dinucleotide biosynthesis protein A
LIARAEVTALILAGGRATRLGGVDKAALVIDGEPILARQRAVLAPRVAEVVVATRAAVDGLRTVVDVIEGAGPLAGIAGGFAAIATPWMLIVAGDMPYLHGALIDLLLATGGDEVDAVAIRIGGRPEPLCGVLGPASRAAVARRIAAGRYKVAGLFLEEGLRIGWVEEEAVRGIDPGLRGLHNVNTAADLRGGGG